MAFPSPRTEYGRQMLKYNPIRLRAVTCLAAQTGHHPVGLPLETLPRLTSFAHAIFTGKARPFQNDTAFPHYCVLRGSSAGLTYLMPQGPFVVTCTTVSSSKKTKCGVAGGSAKKLPAGNAFVALRSAF